MRELRQCFSPRALVLRQQQLVVDQIGRYELSLPVTIMAGDGDRIVSYRLAERLNAAISGSTLQIF